MRGHVFRDNTARPDDSAIPDGDALEYDDPGPEPGPPANPGWLAEQGTGARGFPGKHLVVMIGDVATGPDHRLGADGNGFRGINKSVLVDVYGRTYLNPDPVRLAADKEGDVLVEGGPGPDADGRPVAGNLYPAHPDIAFDLTTKQTKEEVAPPGTQGGRQAQEEGKAALDHDKAFRGNPRRNFHLPERRW